MHPEAFEFESAQLILRKIPLQQCSNIIASSELGCITVIPPNDGHKRGRLRDILGLTLSELTTVIAANGGNAKAYRHTEIEAVDCRSVITAQLGSLQ